MAQEKIEGYSTGDDSSGFMHIGFWDAQTFTIGNTGSDVDFSVESVKLKLYREGDNTGLNVLAAIKEIGTDGAPSGTFLCSGIIPVNIITRISPGSWYETAMSSNPTLSGATQYAVIVGNTDLSIFQSIIYSRFDGTSPTYTGGDRYTSNVAGSFWWKTNSDLIFEVFGTKSSASPTYRTLTTSGIPLNAGIIVPSPGNYLDGTTLGVSGIKNSGFSFVKWDGDLLGSPNPTPLLMDENKTVIGSFAPIGQVLKTAQSTSIDFNTGGSITSATLTSIEKSGTSTYFLSANSGTNWEEVNNGSPHTFINIGSELKWKITSKDAVISLLNLSYS